MITSIFSTEPAGNDFKASAFDREVVLPLIITATLSCPFNFMFPEGSTSTEGIFDKICVIVEPLAAISLPTLKTIFLFLNSKVLFSATTSTSPRFLTSISRVIVPIFKSLLIVEIFNVFVL